MLRRVQENAVRLPWNGRRPLRTPTVSTRRPWFDHLIACAIWRWHASWKLNVTGHILHTIFRLVRFILYMIYSFRIRNVSTRAWRWSWVIETCCPEFNCTLSIIYIYCVWRNLGSFICNNTTIGYKKWILTLLIFFVGLLNMCWSSPGLLYCSRASL
jgi:hypothetical protein